MKPILVTCYVNPDLDGLAGAVAYAEFLQKKNQTAVAGIIGWPHEEARYILDRFGLDYPDLIESAAGFDEVVLVDASDLNGLDGKIPPDKVIEIIDHRQVHEAEKFPNAKAQIELVGAAATLVAEKFMHNGVAISRPAATLLYGAIISNTLNFKAGVTTERDKVAALWLNRTAALPADFWEELFQAKSDLSGPKLAKRIESDLAQFVWDGVKAGIAQIEMIGAEMLVEERLDEIVAILDKMQLEIGFDVFFLNLLELKDDKTILVASDLRTQDALSQALGAQFVGAVARLPRLIMRKQIIPLIKTVLENNH